MNKPLFMHDHVVEAELSFGCYKMAFYIILIILILCTYDSMLLVFWF